MQRSLKSTELISKSKTTRWSLNACNILDEPGDVLICSANVSLNLSGGVGAELLGRYGANMQVDLHSRIHERSPRAAQQGEVFVYAGPELPYKAVIHAVAVDGWYHSTPQVVREIVTKALREAMNLCARKVTLTALATGFGDLTLTDFADAIRPLLDQEFPPIGEVCICLVEDYRVLQLANSLLQHGNME